CAGPLMEFMGVTASCRASFAFYNSLEEVDRLMDGLHLAHDLLV
ncbi:MAG: aminotransferase class V-fold PLP-dependent enzyme, partial [Paracoccaceae bacterium]